ncbi:FAD-dependent oxidoreductase [Mucilaginibacter limnophilus]|uniref:Tryptophan 2-monooxygenase n=1 Tax=Mucilaginibacter limnophilus TaxID=1932778 RepID=A0A437MG01_9SPHI|nr:NAD(P)/FAD-dependent oxidoreductase [Mucilaginibacter limnophilus]RVT96557.1 FAD-dependent oxidoreductase [Mucilaginibacter limnophilus]
MEKTDILIIGAGATGLMAAYKLSKAGKTVTVLEARNRTGGRIHTLNNELFFQHAELGAEFVHGKLPVTLELLKEAGISHYPSEGEMWQYYDGKFEQSENFIEGWDELLEKLKALEKDIPIYDFLQQEFGDEKYKELRESTIQYISGYDTADAKLASSFALRNEWLNEDEDAQDRVNGGYSTLIQFIADEVKKAGNTIVLNAIAQQLLWKPDNVRVVTADDHIFEADKVIIALPLGVLQADKDSPSALTLHPAVSEYTAALNDIGFGAIIKTLLEFDEAFWKDSDIEKLAGASLSDMSFLFTEEVIPTWWTQLPRQNPLLTGWLGGLAAYDKKDMNDEDILQLGLTSLSKVFKIPADVLKRKLVAWHVANWTADPFTLGSYAYDKVESSTARQLLNKSVENTLYFAGEYLYEGPAMGTVEAALTSGKNVANKVLKKTSSNYTG